VPRFVCPLAENAFDPSAASHDTFMRALTTWLVMDQARSFHIAPGNAAL
jgi:hypothetical protein